MKYKFRLVFFHPRPGFFRIDEKSIDYQLNDEFVILIEPRDSDSLLKASNYHIECGGFPSQKDAQYCGEKLRTHLRMLNCMLDLGLSIPSMDGKSGSVSEGIKNKIREDGGGVTRYYCGITCISR